MLLIFSHALMRILAVCWFCMCKRYQSEFGGRDSIFVARQYCNLPLLAYLLTYMDMGLYWWEIHSSRCKVWLGE